LALLLAGPLGFRLAYLRLPLSPRFRPSGSAFALPSRPSRPFGYIRTLKTAQD
jgi:hypothetical protein